jgi:hypothetical protein
MASRLPGITHTRAVRPERARAERCTAFRCRPALLLLPLVLKRPTRPFSFP